MATIREYYERDQSLAVRRCSSLNISDEHSNLVTTATACLHFEPDANAIYASFFVPRIDYGLVCCVAALNCLDTLLQTQHNGAEILLSPTSPSPASAVEVEVEVPPGGRYSFGGGIGAADEPSRLTEGIFTRRVFLYTECALSTADRAELSKWAEGRAVHLIVRGGDYAQRRSDAESPIAFISHDTRDKVAIAKPLALALHNLGCPVWYDEFSMRVGDSLRDSIEKGLRECHKCILILTPHFLANGGWPKVEYDSVFTRELIEGRNVILPIWHGVSRADVYAYSPILANRLAATWTDPDTVGRSIAAAVRS